MLFFPIVEIIVYRSGTYCYKPLNDITCCPSYTIRCDALHFHLKKSHKRVLKNMYNFLKFGQLPHEKTSHQKEDLNNLRTDDHRMFVPEEKSMPVLSFKNGKLIIIFMSVIIGIVLLSLF